MARRRRGTLDEHIGDRIRRRRVELGVTQEQLARALGVTYQQIQKYEAGANRISAVYLHRVAEMLGVPIAWFFEDFAGTPPPGGARSARLVRELLEGFDRIDSEAVRQALAALARAVAERQAGPAAGGRGTRRAPLDGGRGGTTW